MTTLLLKFLLTREINQINRIIDKKILHGQSYASEAKAHKHLLSKLETLKHGTYLAAFL